MEAIQKSYSTQRLLKVKVFRITSYLGSTILGRFKVNFQTYHCEKIVVALIHPRVVPQTFSTHIYMLYYALCTCMFYEREDSEEETWHANSVTLLPVHVASPSATFPHGHWLWDTLHLYLLHVYSKTSERLWLNG